MLAFLCANVLYAKAVWGSAPLRRVVAIGFGFAAGLGVISILTSFD